VIIYIVQTLKYNQMKKLLLFSLMLITLNATSQIEKIQGIWESDESEYLTAIFYKNGNFTFSNIGKSKLEETVVDQGKDFVSTSCLNTKNGHKVSIRYTLLDNGNMHAVFKGDWNGIVIHERYNE